MSTVLRNCRNARCEEQGYETTLVLVIYEGRRYKRKVLNRRNRILSEFFRLPRITFHDQIVYGIDNHIVEEARFICRIARRHDRGTVLLDGKSISINRDAARTRLKVITHASAFIAEILFYDYH